MFKKKNTSPNSSSVDSKGRKSTSPFNQNTEATKGRIVITNGEINNINQEPALDGSRSTTLDGSRSTTLDGSRSTTAPTALGPGSAIRSAKTGAQAGWSPASWSPASLPPSTHYDKVAILDAGAQYGKVIDRRVRELNVFSSIYPLDTPLATLLSDNCKCIIISGGPNFVGSGAAPVYDEQLLSSGLPVLGICYGMQLIVSAMKGEVVPGGTRQDGQYQVHVKTDCPLFSRLDDKQRVLLTHGDRVKSCGPSLKVVSQTESGVITGVANDEKRLYGVQFHPEVDLTENGLKMLENFIINMSHCRANFTISDRRQNAIDEIRQVVGPSRRVLMLLSGGVDSTVACALLTQAIQADRIIALHIDNGFMRSNESEQVVSALGVVGVKVEKLNAGPIFLNSTVVDCEQMQQFLETTVQSVASAANPTLSNLVLGPSSPVRSRKTPADRTRSNYEQFANLPAHRERRPEDALSLSHVDDPEQKRKIIGDTFIRVVLRFIEEHRLDLNEMCLCQGTLRPDLIESASAEVSTNAWVIKTHHNDTPLVRLFRRRGLVVEPLKDFHKDEVRRLGRDLNLDHNLVQRHPFPGPGLAVRIICSLKPYRCDNFSSTETLVKSLVHFHRVTQRQTIQLFKESLSSAELNNLQRWSANWALGAQLLPIRTVGVQGDSRSYSYVAVLSTNQKLEELNFQELADFGKMITRVCRAVNRVCYAFGSRIEYPVEDITPTRLGPLAVSQLRAADRAAHEVLKKANLLDRITQMPVVLIPVHFDREVANSEYCPSVQRSIVLRPFLTRDFMTGLAAIPGADLPLKDVSAMVEAVGEIPGISRVLYDLTNKPPGTTEWE